MSPGDRDGWAGWLGELRSQAAADGGLAALERIADRVVGHAYLCRGERVLDVGAGSGLLALKAAGEVGPTGRVVALDSEESCLLLVREAASSRGLGNVSTARADMVELPFAAGSFDAVVARSALVYSDDLGRSLREIARVLEPGGRYSFFEPLPGELSWRFAPGVDAGRFEGVEKLLGEGRRNGSLTRSVIRDELSSTFADVKTLPVRYGIRLEGRSEEEIVEEYLYDLPGELGALRVLASVMKEEEVRDIVRGFAGVAARGDVTGALVCLFAWGVK